MKYLFIYGRNPELSREEIFSWFTRKGIKVESSSLKKNCVLVETKETLDAGIIDDFGGIIGIGTVLCSLNDLDKTEVYYGEKNNFSFVLWDFSSETDETRERLKKRFKDERLKASEKPIKGIKPSSKLLDVEYFVYDDFFGIVNQTNNYEEIEKRDMQKPVRREELSISPRLAKIMINLSEVKGNQFLVDPFCGIGVVLFEALLQDINVIGIDKDKNAVEGSRENLKWGKFHPKNYELIMNDSSKVKIKRANVIVTEPDLGETLRKEPTPEKIRNIMNGFENLMISVLNNLKTGVSGRIVFTSPLIYTKKERVSCNYKRILEQTKLKLVKGFPIKEFREDQIVGREVFVLEKI
jgi:tRNA G10  N-methylase Trm11